MTRLILILAFVLGLCAVTAEASGRKVSALRVRGNGHSVQRQVVRERHGLFNRQIVRHVNASIGHSGTVIVPSNVVFRDHSYGRQNLRIVEHSTYVTPSTVVVAAPDAGTYADPETPTTTGPVTVPAAQTATAPCPMPAAQTAAPQVAYEVAPAPAYQTVQRIVRIVSRPQFLTSRYAYTSPTISRQRFLRASALSTHCN